MSDAWQPDANPFRHASLAVNEMTPCAGAAGAPRARRSSHVVLHDARPSTAWRPSEPLSEEHDGNCVVGVAWAFLIEVPFLIALGWAIAALLRAAIH